MFSPTCFLRLRFLVLEVDLLMFHPIQVRRSGSVVGVGVLVAGIVSLWRPVSGLFLHRRAEYRGGWASSQPRSARPPPGGIGSYLQPSVNVSSKVQKADYSGVVHRPCKLTTLNPAESIKYSRLKKMLVVGRGDCVTHWVKCLVLEEVLLLPRRGGVRARAVIIWPGPLPRLHAGDMGTRRAGHLWWLWFNMFNGNNLTDPRWWSCVKWNYGTQVGIVGGGRVCLGK